MSFEESVKRGVLFGFIPKHLNVGERSELNVFPLNVLFAQYKMEDGRRIMGSALYSPDIGSFERDDAVGVLKYYNIHDKSSWLEIFYDYEKLSYVGEKIVRGKSVGGAYGKEWKMFFAHFTKLGLANGERCEFSDIS